MEIDKLYIANLQKKIEHLELEMSHSETSSDPKKMKACIAEYTNHKKILNSAINLYQIKENINESELILNDPTSDLEFKELAKQELEESINLLKEAEKSMRISLIPTDPSDNKNVIIEIRAGTGGDEAGIFCGDLFRMYTKFFDLQKWKYKIFDVNPCESGGYKEICFGVEGNEVYKRLKYEAGTHRVQRVPQTETQGRVHTSAATVAVLAEAEEIDVEIKNEDLRIDTYRASGAGGQHVNTTDSAIRITHLPTGVVVQCQDERSQHKNKAAAMKMLRSKIYDDQQSKKAQEEASIRKSMVGSGDRSEKIRTYNFPQNRLTDHRINLTIYKLDRIIEGDLNEILNALYEYDLEQKLLEQMDI